MKGTLLRFYVHENRKHHHILLYEWLLEHAKKTGIHGGSAFRAIAGLRDRISPHLFVSEIRTVAADSLWMSPCYQQACVTIHFTWKPEWPAVQKLLPLIEERLAPFNARPHWGKLFTMAPSRLRSVYKRLAQFQELLRSYDPRGKFSNAFLETYILDRR